jgi:uncharacterized membrane protein YkoI
MKEARYLIVVALMLGALGVIATAGFGDEGREAASAEMPALVAGAVAKAFPNAEVREVEKENENGFLLYTVTLASGGNELDVEVAPDGTIIGVEKEVSKGDLPAAVAAALAAAGGGEIKEVVRIETHAELKLVKLDKPAVTYEAAVVVNGKTVELTIDSTGKVIAEKAGDEDDDGDDDGEDADDDGDNDDQNVDGQPVEMGQLPAAVQAVIQKAAAGNPIKEIEAITKGGATIYEVDWMAGGKEVEIRVSADGKLLDREAEDGEGEDD